MITTFGRSETPKQITPVLEQEISLDPEQMKEIPFY